MNFWKDQRVLVTGGAGFIGSHLVDRLLEEGADVTIFDSLERGKLENLQAALDGAPDRCQLVKVDLRERGWFEKKWCWDEKYDAVFLLAAKMAHIAYNIAHQFEMQIDNELIVANSFRNLARTGAGRVLYTSTVCVYPHDAPIPTPESAADVCNPEPTNWGYGVAKWAGEQLAKSFYKEYDIPTAIVRFSNALGIKDYYDDLAHVAPALIRKCFEAKREGRSGIEVWGTGDQSRVLVDARDLAKALLIVAEKGADGLPTNIGHDREVTIKKLAKIIVDMIDPKLTITYDTTRPDGHDRRQPDLTRLKEITGGWTPDTPLETTLKEMVDEYQRDHD